MADTTTDNFALVKPEPGSASWDVKRNNHLDALDSILINILVMSQLSVIDKDLTAPPGAPVDRDIYIIAAAATGAWNGFDGSVAIWSATAGAWAIFEPKDGWVAWVIDEGAGYRYTVTGWIGDGRPVLLETQIYTAGQATIDFDTKFTETYDHYFVEFSKLYPSADCDLYMRIKASGAWQSLNDYIVTSTNERGGLIVDGISLGEIDIANSIISAQGLNGAAACRGRADIYMYDAAVDVFAGIDVVSKFPQVGTSLSIQNAAASYRTAESITGIRFVASAGTIEGEFRLYGVPK